MSAPSLRMRRLESAGGRVVLIHGVVLSCATLALCACGSKAGDLSAAPGTGSAEANGSSASGSSSNAATDDDSGMQSGSAANDASAGDPRTLWFLAYGGGPGEVVAEGGLFESGVGPQQTCTGVASAGACQLTSCTFGGVGSPAPGYGNLGPMSASVGATTVPLVYDFTGYPSVGFPSSVTLGMGDSMRFRGGNGGDVPLFDVSSIIPGRAVLTSPVATTDGGAAIIDTSQDLSVTWSPIAIGQVHFQLEGGDSSRGGFPISISCTFDGASGSGAVSQTLLAPLEEMSGTTPTYVDFVSELDATTLVDGLSIETHSYPSSTGTDDNFSVTLQ